MNQLQHEPNMDQEFDRNAFALQANEVLSGDKDSNDDRLIIDEKFVELCQQLDEIVLVDLDNTVWDKGVEIDGASKFLNDLEELGITIVFCSANGSTWSRTQGRLVEAGLWNEKRILMTDLHYNPIEVIELTNTFAKVHSSPQRTMPDSELYFNAIGKMMDEFNKNAEEDSLRYDIMDRDNGYDIFKITTYLRNKNLRFLFNENAKVMVIDDMEENREGPGTIGFDPNDGFDKILGEAAGLILPNNEE